MISGAIFGADFGAIILKGSITSHRYKIKINELADFIV